MKLYRIIAAILWFCFSLFGQSQISTGIIQGVIRDSTGGVLPGVEVTVKHLETGISRSCRTSAEGLFTATLLPVGIYELSVERKSFAQTRISGISVTVGQTRSIEVTMKPASIVQYIEVLDPNSTEAFEKTLAHLQIQLWQKKNLQEHRQIQSEIFALEQHLGSSRKAGRHNIEAQTFPSVPLAEFQKALYPGEIILEYVLREPSSICLAISRGGVQGVELAPGHVIENAVAAYREEILQGRQGVQIAHTLYSLLLAPIPDLDQKLRITIIPDGMLHLLPFEAILAPSGRFLIDSHLIDYSPSSTIMLLLRKMAAIQENSGRFLGVGDARLPSGDESGAVFANIPQPVRLPGSRAEILSIVKELKNEFETVVLLGEDANETGIKALNLSEFDILHFAVHGTSDIDFPARSALLLGSSSDGTEDGILQAWEISRLRLKADLVVLSACDTAVGRLLDQVGVSNLVQSFLLAGARSVVASIWPTEDRPTADLMIRFYSYLAQGMDKGSALRQAKLDFIAKYKDKALPVHWAGMLMIGDSSDSILGKHRGNDAGDELR